MTRAPRDEDGTPSADPHQRVRELRDGVLASLGPLLEGVRDYALIDAANYPNPGDNAIYLGQLACFRALGLPVPRYVCDFLTYDPSALRRAVPRGPVLLTGGGSFGDLWPTAQACREDVLRSFPDRRVIQLPQTLHFDDPRVLDRTRQAVAAHPAFTLFVRDQASVDMATRELGVSAMLCPDMAFCLGPLHRATPRASTDGRRILLLLREDKESAGARLADVPDDCVRHDWTPETGTWLRGLSYRLIGAVRKPILGPVARPALMALFPHLARQRLGRALELLRSAPVLVTDRLHGHILALLLAIPHVVVDTRQGKISAFRAAWTMGVDRVRSAPSPAAAIAIARELAAASGA